MDKQQHTPGPWDVTPSGYHVYDEHGNVTADCAQPDIGSLEERKANARLIAAAPELLAMVERLTDARENITRAETYRDARALIARVRGEA